MPLGRNANMHMYNNYYSGSTGTNMSIRANGYAFVENSYFDKCNNPVECLQGTKDNFRNLGVVKSYQNVFNSCKGKNDATIVSSRTETVSNSNTYGQNFDTDSSIFYYDTVKQESKVRYLTTAEEAKLDCIKYSGVLKDLDESSGSLPNTEVKYKVTFKVEGENDKTLEYLENSIIDYKPTKEGFKFVGWYLENSFTTLYNAPITKDLTLYAKFEENNQTTVMLDLTDVSAKSDISENIVVDDTFKIIATSDKKIDIKTGTWASSYNEQEYNFTKRIDLKGSINSSDKARSIEVKLQGSAKLTVIYFISSSNTRKIGLYNNSGSVEDDLGSSNSNIRVCSFENVEEGTYYIGSTNSSLSILGIIIEY
jgi:uncharacterized repeat protein (TIGR02543 family)